MGAPIAAGSLSGWLSARMGAAVGMSAATME